jgi:hypothetical protein
VLTVRRKHPLTRVAESHWSDTVLLPQQCNMGHVSRMFEPVLCWKARPLWHYQTTVASPDLMAGKETILLEAGA